MAKKAETTVQTNVQKAIAKLGGSSIKLRGGVTQVSGEPDIMGWIPYEYGYLHLMLEVKTEDGKPEPLQLYKLRKYWEAGYLAAVVTSPDDVVKLRDAYKNWVDTGLITDPYPFICCLREQGLEDTYNIYHRKDENVPCLKILERPSS